MRTILGVVAVLGLGCSQGEAGVFGDGAITFGPSPTTDGPPTTDDTGSDPATGDESGATSTSPPDTGCVPQTEVCNGIDDDCNGEIDESDPMLGEACDTGMSGACAPGAQACEGGGLLCVPDARATAEVCNGIDDDCNGEIDDGNPEGGAVCSTGLPGICDAGTEACTMGSLQCEQDQVAAATETCGNGLDDDCNGSTDEGCLACADVDLGSAVPQSVGGSNVGQGDSFTASCGGGGGADTLYRFVAPAAGTYTFDMIGSSFDTVLVAYSDCMGTEIACNDDFAGNPSCGCCSCSQISLTMAAGEAVLLAVDGYSGATGAFTLNISN